MYCSTHSCHFCSSSTPVGVYVGKRPIHSLIHLFFHLLAILSSSYFPGPPHAPSPSTSYIYLFYQPSTPLLPFSLFHGTHSPITQPSTEPIILFHIYPHVHPSIHSPIHPCTPVYSPSTFSLQGHSHPSLYLSINFSCLTSHPSFQTPLVHSSIASSVHPLVHLSSHLIIL